MSKGRKVAAAAVVGLIVVVAAGWWLTGGPSGVRDEIVGRRVREVAVGTWACTVTWDGEVEWRRSVAITSDGRLGVGTTDTDTFVEGGTWKLDGLKATVTTPLNFQGMPFTARLTYTGDADPPTRVVVLDRTTGDTGRFAVALHSDELTATQHPTGSDGTAHTKRIHCTKASSDEPELEPA